VHSQNATTDTGFSRRLTAVVRQCLQSFDRLGSDAAHAINVVPRSERPLFATSSNETGGKDWTNAGQEIERLRRSR
jgi:hypothetical protein